MPVVYIAPPVGPGYNLGPRDKLFFKVPFNFVAPGGGSGSGIAPNFGVWSLPNGSVGSAYLLVFDMPIPDRPITFSSIGLPAWLTLGTVNTHSFSLSGTPTTAGTYSFTILASNVDGSTSYIFSITVNPAAIYNSCF